MSVNGYCGNYHYWNFQKDNNTMFLFSTTTSPVRKESSYSRVNIVHGYMIEKLFYDEMKNVGYIVIDVCENQHVLADVLSKLILYKWKYSSVVTVMSLEMNKLAASILLPWNITFLAFTLEPMYPKILVEHRNNVFYFNTYQTFLKQYQNEIASTMSILIIHACNGTEHCDKEKPTAIEYTERNRFYVKRKSLCYKEWFINIQDDVDIYNAANFANNHANQFNEIVFTGNYKVLSSIHRYKKIFNRHLRIFYDQRIMVCEEVSSLKLKVYGLRSCAGNFSFVQVNAAWDFYNLIDFIYSFQYVRESLSRNAVHYFWYDWFLKRKADEADVCIRPICSPGHEANFGFFKDKAWSKSFGWHCRICEGNTIRHKRDTKYCEPCRSPLMADALKRYCFDPYEDDFITYQSRTGMAVLIISALSFCLSLLSLACFANYRHSPIVLSSDRTVAFFQLTGNTLLSLIVPFLFIGKPNVTVCLIRPIVIGLLITAASSLTLSKTQKFLMIFEAKYQIGKRKILFTKALHYTMLASTIAVCILLLYMTTQKTPSKLLTHESEKKLKREIYCNTGLHLQVQFMYNLVLLFICSIQGFRSRKLPSTYKDTSRITLLCFISLVFFICSSVLYFSAHSKVRRDFLLVCTILFVSIGNVLFLYIQKVYLILFKPQRNSTAVIEDKILKRNSKPRVK